MAPPSVTHERVGLRRAALLLLDLVFPLYTFGLTRERRRYWRLLPTRRAAKLFVALFLVLGGVPFFLDLLAGGTFPLWGVLLFAVALGTLRVVTILTELRRPRLMIIPIFIIFAAFFLFARLPRQERTPEFTRRRIVMDGSYVFLSIMLGYRLFLSFTTTEGVAHVTLQTELSFAHGLQSTLVPPISYCGQSVQVFGCSIPSAKVGGDLVDLVADGDNVLVYLADVSGHGIPAGILMGMLKTAIRQAWLTQQPLPALLESVNAVLPAVKEPEMYATLAALRFGASSQVEFAVAGHPPILHYHEKSHDISRCAMRQYPLGLVPQPGYASEHVCCDPGDLFVVVSDGLIETMNAGIEEFGLARLEKSVLAHATESLPEIYEALLRAVSDFGEQRDDRTVLIVRIREKAEDQEFSRPIDDRTRKGA
jgi:Stage II sporulation protein E (SpoIIE)